MDYNNKPVCFVELSQNFSKLHIDAFTEVFYFFKKHAIDKDSLIRKLHLGYTAMRPEAFDFVVDNFPWIEEFRLRMGLSKRLNFLETHGLDKPEFKIHIDGKPGQPHVMFNVPILNCTTETITYWVEPLDSFDPILACENSTSDDTSRGATPHMPESTKFEVLTSHSFTSRAALFRSDIYHGVKNTSNRNEYRIMMHWWFPDYVTWDSAVNMFKDHL